MNDERSQFFKRRSLLSFQQFLYNLNVPERYWKSDEQRKSSQVTVQVYAMMSTLRLIIKWTFGEVVFPYRRLNQLFVISFHKGSVNLLPCHLFTCEALQLSKKQTNMLISHHFHCLNWNGSHRVVEETHQFIIVLI